MTKPRLGDILEISTKKGLAYAQYTHQHRQYGGLIRVFDKICEKRPDDFRDVAAGSVRFSTFFPVTAALKRALFPVVSHQEIAPHNREFPLFRDGVADPKTKKVAVWWLWDGEKEWRVTNLTAEQRKLPLRAIWDDTLLIERIESGWVPNQDTR